jgi:hypothetical protein
LAGSLPVIIFVDEASGIGRDDWRNSLYGQLRAIANARASARTEDLPSRLNFVFSGTFRPESLVNEKNSPFNVCERIDTDDLTLNAAHDLWMLGAEDVDDEGVVERAYEFLGGQPYLLQFVFSRSLAAASGERTTAYEDAVDELRSGADDHLENVFGKVFADQRLSPIAAGLAATSGVLNEPANNDFRYLQVLGVAKRSGNHLLIRNELYREFVAASSQLQATATSAIKPRTQPAALFALPEEEFSHFSDQNLAEIAFSAYQGAVESYRAQSFRLALAGFGCTLEAVLIDFLSSVGVQTLETAAKSARPNLNRGEDTTNPKTLRLVNLLKIAAEVPKIRSVVQVSDVVRDWRNQIHPAVALTNYRPESDLEPEARMSSALLCALLRDIRAP